MNSAAVNYLLGPQAARLRVRISAVFVAVAAIVFVASPGLWVTALWLVLVVAWGGVTVSAYRRARVRPSASISAPKAGVLAVPEDERFDLDAFVERTRRKYGPPEQRTHHDRLAIEAEVDAYAARVVERREAQRRQRDEVRIVNGAGDTLAVHPCRDSGNAQPPGMRPGPPRATR